MNRYKVIFTWTLNDKYEGSRTGTFTAETAADAEECAIQAWYDPALADVGWVYSVEVTPLEDSKVPPKNKTCKVVVSISYNDTETEAERILQALLNSTVPESIDMVLFHIGENTERTSLELEEE